MGFTRAELEAYRDTTLPDLTGPGLRLLFVGINPGLWTAAAQSHFARRGNRFYPALYRAGITDRVIDASAGYTADDYAHLIERGVGITNVVARATARADELDRAELVAGGRDLIDRVVRLAPSVVAILGVTAYRAAFNAPRAATGRQPRRPRRRPAMGRAESQRAERARQPGCARSLPTARSRSRPASRSTRKVAAVPVQLHDLTTIRLGGPAKRYEVAGDSDQLVDLVRKADARGEPVLVMSGGSNLVVGDQGFDGLVVRVASNGLRIDGTTVQADAGVDWDTVVAASLEAGLAGIEALSGIPGSVGGTPIQNVGAYGTLTSDVLSAVTVYDRMSHAIQVWEPSQCGFGRHRQSIFKRNNRYVILEVTLRAAALAALGTDRLPAPGRSSRGRAGRRGRGGQGTGGRARPARRERDAARRDRSRHLERRLVLSQPDRRRSAGEGERMPGLRRPGRVQAARRVADQSGRLRARLRSRVSATVR